MNDRDALKPDARAPSTPLPGEPTFLNPSSDRGSRLSRDLSADQQFWQLWRRGGRPDPRVFLAARPGLTATEVAAVLAIDQYERWLKGERTRAEDYLSLLPPGDDRDQAACDIIYGEFLLREQLGEHPDSAEYN